MMATVEVIEGSQVRHSTWKAEMDAGKVNQVDPGLVRIFFGSSADLESTKPSSVSADLPRELLAAVTKDLNGLFGNRVNGNWDELWYTFKIKQVTDNPNRIAYHWDQVTSFSRWDALNNRGIVLCLDCPPHTKESLKSLWQSQTLNLRALNADFLEATKDLYDESVWSLRDCVRAAEHARDNFNVPNFAPDFIRLHEIARHITHSDETLDVTIELIECIREVLKEKSKSIEDRNAENKMRALQMQVRALARRSTSLKDRLQNEINLAFNLVTQRDSKIMVDLGDNSRKDSNNMKSIAVVGLVYLPGTFISGLFGMNFFDFDATSQLWRVSNNFWMYWAITIPVTLLTVLVWVIMFHRKAFQRTFVLLLMKARK